MIVQQSSVPASFYKSISAVVAGATEFLGYFIVQRLADQGASVKALVEDTSDEVAIFRNNIVNPEFFVVGQFTFAAITWDFRKNSYAHWDFRRNSYAHACHAPRFLLAGSNLFLDYIAENDKVHLWICNRARYQTPETDQKQPTNIYNIPSSRYSIFVFRSSCSLPLVGCINVMSSSVCPQVATILSFMPNVEVIESNIRQDDSLKGVFSKRCIPFEIGLRVGWNV